MRWPLALWNLAFSRAEAYRPDPSHDAAWNRGAYLVQGLGHCGGCHTPRGALFQEKALDQSRSAYLSGGNLDDWFASDLRNDDGNGLRSWSAAEIAVFLKTGHNGRASAFGTMTDVVNNSTQYLTDEDLAAIASYLKALPSSASKSQVARPGGSDAAAGARLYAQQCAPCHLASGQGRPPYIAPLAGNPTMMDEDPASLINVTLNGAARVVAAGQPDAYRMPQYRVLLDDDGIAAIVNFMRASWGQPSTWVSSAKVAAIRKQTEPAMDSVVVLKMR
jgi:mono/diheme cytochrome c family protein